MSDEPPDPSKPNNQRKWRSWHEREVPVKVSGQETVSGLKIAIDSKQLSTILSLHYPNSIWTKYPTENKVKLIDNLTYIFTAHLPFLLKGNIRLEYNTGYPHSYSWANQCFARFLPAYWYLYRGRRGTKFFPLLKTLLNSRAFFVETKDTPPRFPKSIDENLIIPFTFGKDSFLSYYLAKKLNLNPTLIYFDEPTEEYSKRHKLKLIHQFIQETGQKIFYLDNPLGSLREYGEGWFGWELALTSWALLSLPFAYATKAGYLIFSNESSCNDFFYDSQNLKVIPDYEQSGQATEELSLLIQALSEGEVYVSSFLQGLDEIAIIAILKQNFPQAFKYLMSCWAESQAAKNKRWCASCSKCARIFLYLSANGIDPLKQAGFKDNLFQLKFEKLFNVFENPVVGTGFDAFGTNRDEQLFAFYLTFLKGNRQPLIKKFADSYLKIEAQNRFNQLLDKYFKLKPEFLTPPQWKSKIDKFFSQNLNQIYTQAFRLYQTKK